jgi:hypothetical protein
MKKDVTPNEAVQSKIFLAGEGDSLFGRNKQQLETVSEFYETDVIQRVLKSYKEKIRSVLEIGCSNGAHLETLCNFFQATGQVSILLPQP